MARSMAATSILPSWVEIVQTLQQSALFQSLGDDALAEVAASAQPRVYGRDALLTADTALDSYYLISRGRVRFFLLSHDGRKVTLGGQHAHDVFWFARPNQLVLHRQVEQITHCAVVMEDRSVLCALPYLCIRRLAAAHPSFALALADQIYRWNLEFCDRIWELAYDPVTTRLARVLARLALASSEHVVTETHDELAWWVGTSRARVTKELHRLRSLGYIEYRPHRHAIQVLDPERLDGR